VIFASGSATVGPLQRATRTVPIVFVATPDPVGAGFVESLARASSKAWRFMNSIFRLVAILNFVEIVLKL
jgi:putative ABC transport system substrate-binding protein